MRRRATAVKTNLHKGGYKYTNDFSNYNLATFFCVMCPKSGICAKIFLLRNFF